MNISYVLSVVHILNMIPTHSHSLILSSYLVNDKDTIDLDFSYGDYDDGDIEEDLLDEDIDQMMSNDLNSDFDLGCPGLDYLGVGYDSIYANSMGEDSSILDPGYRAPIIEFSWRKNSEGYSPTLGSLHPVGGWVRPVFSCSRSTKISEISNLDELKDSLSASAKLSGDISENSFTGSLEYKNSFSNMKSKRQKTYNKTEKCIRYQVGIPLNLPWNYTKSFEYSISKLPVIGSSEIRDCDIRNKSKSYHKCEGTKPWIKFFEMFGTHFNHQLTLGGKITQSMRFDVSKLEELQKRGIDIDFEIKTELGSGSANLKLDAKRDKSRLADMGTKKMSVIGGQMPNFPLDDVEFANWAQTVAENPMPIGVSATSLKTLIDPKLHGSYDVALHQYGILNGISYEQLQTISGNVTEFSKEVAKSVSVVSWNGNNKIKCPTGSKVLFGLSLVFGENNLLGINYCKPKLADCTVPTYADVRSSYKWISCSYGLQPSANQLVKMSKENEKNVMLECPEHSSVQIGLIIVTRDKVIISISQCKYGLKSCDYDLSDGETAYIWTVCYHHREGSNRLELNFLLSELSKNSRLKCPDGYRITSGFVAFSPYVGKSNLKDPEECEKGDTKCAFNPGERSIGFVLCKSSS